MTSPRIRRGFVDVGAGQAHYRYAGTSGNSALPLVMIHASPGSAKMLEPLLKQLALTRPVFAIDTLGNGDSSAPVTAKNSSDRPGLEVFVEGHQQAIAGLGLERFDLYGSHTGGNIACEIALAWPNRVAHLVLDGMSLYSDEERAELSQHYANGIELESDGAHLIRVWNFVRDSYLFWPWYKRGASNRRTIGLPPPEILHDKAIEVLKATQTYHFSYNAAFLYRKESRLPLLQLPTLLTVSEQDMLLEYTDRVAALIPLVRKVITSDNPVDRAACIREFLEDACR